MKFRNVYLLCGAICCMLVFSQNAIGQDIVKDVDITSENAKVEMTDETPSSYFVEIGGPNNYYHKQRVDYTNEISLSSLNAEGEKFEDGLYSLQITPVFELTEEQRSDLSEMRMKNDQVGIAAYRKANGLPDVVDKFAMNFRIQQGKYVIPTQQEGELNLPTMSSSWELDHPSLYASINTVGLDFPDHATDNSALAGVGQTFATDVMIQGSLCVGVDCSSSESFGFDTIRLKENNLRIKFQDTSVSASFPSNDWQITANDSSNGGANKFSIDDIDGGRTPFTIEASAPTHSLYVEADGDIGLGNSNPVVELHITDGDSPTMRLEQNGSSGFTQQTWDVAGNETNFFVRDVTNSSTLPFKITPGAPDNLLYLKGGSHDNIGIRTTSPNSGAVMHFNTTNSILLPLGTDAQRPAPVAGMLRGNSTSNIVEYYNGSSWLDLTASGGGGSTFLADDGSVSSPSYSFTNDSNTGFYRPTADQVNFSANGQRALVITANGVQANGGSASVPSWSYIGDTNTGIYHPSMGNVAITTGGTERLRVNSSGNVGIGCTNPSSALHVNGTISTTAVSVATSVACSSDRRFKKNISPLQNSLEKVLNLQGVNYDWKIDEFPDKHFNEGQQLGFIAQEIEEVLPLVVQTDKEGYKSVDYSRLTPVLVEAIKEQQTIIDAQQAEINSLQSQVASLEELKAQVAALTQMVMKQNDDSVKSVNQIGDE